MTVEAILIAGPTASGKSALALALARRLDGVVINADSMQVYRDLRVITARPGDEDERQAPHALYGVVDGAENFSVSRWLAAVSKAIAAAKAAGRMPILVGGTGLYLKALTQGLSNIPAVPAEVRAEVRDWAAGLAPAALHAALAERDPATAARLRPTDPQRLLRALEVHAATGGSLASWQANRGPPLLDAARCVAVFLAPEREALRARIDARFDAMMSEGALDEVAALAQRGLDPALPVMRAHGVPPLLRYLAGTSELAAAVATGKADTRRYIKRQATFARHQLPSFAWIVPEEAEAHVLAALERAPPQSS